jgi:hypothetical protein
MNKGFDMQRDVEPSLQPGVGETHRLGPLSFCIRESRITSLIEMNNAG